MQNNQQEQNTQTELNQSNTLNEQQEQIKQNEISLRNKQTELNEQRFALDRQANRKLSQNWLGERKGFISKYVKLKYLAYINIITIAMFGLDKQIASRTLFTRRVPERLLHSLSFFGGTPASIFSIYFFKHKNHTPSFLLITYSILIMQLAVYAKFN